MNTSTGMLIIGLLSVLAGIFALFNPLSASIAVEILTGWSFLILGLMLVFFAFRITGWSGRIWAILLGVLMLLVGISLLANPLAGVVALTWVLGVSFLASGVFKTIAGLGLPTPGLKWSVVLSGVISVILGIMILTNLPGSAVVALGVLLGIELLSSGISSIAFARARKSVSAQ